MATQTELVITSVSKAPEPKSKKSTRRSKKKSRKHADERGRLQPDGRKQKGPSSPGHPETKKKYGSDRGVTKPLAREA